MDKLKKLQNIFCTMIIKYSITEVLGSQYRTEIMYGIKLS